MPSPLGSRPFTSARCLTIFITFGLALTSVSIEAQTFQVLHSFTGGLDGATPYAGLTVDRAGNLYGTTSAWSVGSGTVFRLSKRTGTWIFSPLYIFNGGSDGRNPNTRVVFGPDGALYGTTLQGGQSWGTVFKLQPPLSICHAVSCPWTETVVYAFGQGGSSDGLYPNGEIAFDPSGNLYGVTQQGGATDYGTVYELTRTHGTYVHSILYSFNQNNNEVYPEGLLSFDGSGNLYGIAAGILGDDSNIYELTHSGAGWEETKTFNQYTQQTGGYPSGGVIVDGFANVYGANALGGANNGGVVFELSPSGGGWTFNVLNALPGGTQNGGGPGSFLFMDSQGDIFGTTVANGSWSHGSVFELKLQSGSWVYTSLHDFTGGSDGSEPFSNVVLDSNGSLYGTTTAGGDHGYGVVWEITP